MKKKVTIYSLLLSLLSGPVSHAAGTKIDNESGKRRVGASAKRSTGSKKRTPRAKAGAGRITRAASKARVNRAAVKKSTASRAAALRAKKVVKQSRAPKVLRATAKRIVKPAARITKARISKAAVQKVIRASKQRVVRAIKSRVAKPAVNARSVARTALRATASKTTLAKNINKRTTTQQRADVRENKVSANPKLNNNGDATKASNVVAAQPANEEAARQARARAAAVKNDQAKLAAQASAAAAAVRAPAGAAAAAAKAVQEAALRGEYAQLDRFIDALLVHWGRAPAGEAARLNDLKNFVNRASAKANILEKKDDKKNHIVREVQPVMRAVCADIDQLVYHQNAIVREIDQAIPEFQYIRDRLVQIDDITNDINTARDMNDVNTRLNYFKTLVDEIEAQLVTLGGLDCTNLHPATLANFNAEIDLIWKYAAVYSTDARFGPSTAKTAARKIFNIPAAGNFNASGMTIAEMLEIETNILGAAAQQQSADLSAKLDDLITNVIVTKNCRASINEITNIKTALDNNIMRGGFGGKAIAIVNDDNIDEIKGQLRVQDRSVSLLCNHLINPDTGITLASGINVANLDRLQNEYRQSIADIIDPLVDAGDIIGSIDDVINKHQALNNEINRIAAANNCNILNNDPAHNSILYQFSNDYDPRAAGDNRDGIKDRCRTYLGFFPGNARPAVAGLQQKWFDVAERIVGHDHAQIAAGGFTVEDVLIGLAIDNYIQDGGLEA